MVLGQGEQSGERALLAAILARAMRDLHGPNPIERREAESWFKGWAHYAHPVSEIGERTGWTCREVCQGLDLEYKTVVDECFREWTGVDGAKNARHITRGR
jgi:hypothetical protein